jgi:predicted GIY-YIG superfamily endonuclease
MSGIYVWGLKININQSLKFVPLYVGIAKDLGARLWTHYCNNRENGNWNWYVFDYCSVKNLSDVSDLYKSIYTADFNIKKINKSFKHRYTDKLIWFNDKDFFNLKLNTKHSNYFSDSGVLSSILPGGDLDQIILADNQNKDSCNFLKNNIICAKKIFNDNFYFVYTTLDTSIEAWSINKKDGFVKQKARNIEVATKCLLQKIGVFTGSDSKKNIDNFNTIQIDLRNIQNDLINLGFSNNENHYNSPLILKNI